MTRYDPWAVPAPNEQYDFVVDGDPIRRMPAGSVRLLQAEHSAVRLVPDSAFRVWRNQAVFVREEMATLDGRDVATVLRIRGSICLGARGVGGDLFDFEAVVIDPAKEALVSVAAADTERHAVELAARRAVDWYRAELERREGGERPMLTSAELWLGDSWARRPS